MVVRLGGAICVAAITFACSSYSVSSIGFAKELTPRPVASGPGIVGLASSYNPYRKDNRSGGIETASSERYDPTTSTAAIHISYLADYVYSEVPPDKKPADIVLNSLKDIPIGTLWRKLSELPKPSVCGQVCGLLDIFAGRAASFEACALRPTWASYS
jgi:hypothetical protein